MTSNLIFKLSVNLALSVFSLLFVFLIFESTYILVMNHQIKDQWYEEHIPTEFDPELGWKPKTDFVSDYKQGKASHNRLGFRSSEIDPSKKQVLLLGDSVVWGYDVDDKETLSFFLEEKMSSQNYQVSNMGVSGFGFEQYYLFFKKNLLEFKVLETVILVVCTGNDFENTAHSAPYGKEKPVFRYRAGGIVFPERGIRKFGFLNLWDISFTSRSLKKIPGFKNRLQSLFSRRLSNEETEKVILFAVEEIKRMTEQAGGDFYLVLSPRKKDFSGETPEHEFYRRFFKKHGIKFVDLAESLEETSKAEIEKMYVAGDNFHYSRLGNAKIAEILKPLILAQAAED